MKLSQSTESFNHFSGSTNKEETYKSDLKLTLLLTTGIFFMIAPSPSVHDLARMTANFLISASVVSSGTNDG